MSNNDPRSEMPVSAPQRGRLRRTGAYIAVAVVGVTLAGAFAGSSIGPAFGHRMLTSISGMMAAAAPFDRGFALGFAADWRSGLLNDAIDAAVEVRADRMIRHLAIEIDATADQQDKLRAVVRSAVQDLLPMREKLLAARATARDLLTQQTIDRAAIEKFRADQITVHDAASKRIVQAVADAAEILTPEQRRKLSNMLASRVGAWGGGRWGHGPWRNWGGFGRD